MSDYHARCRECGRGARHYIKGLCPSCYGRGFRQSHKQQIQGNRQEYYQGNRNKELQRGKAYHQANRDKILQRKRAYRKGRQEQIREYMREWRQSHKEGRAAYRRHWHTEHAEKETVRARRWRAEHKEELAAYKRRRYAEDMEHRGKIAARHRRWQRQNPEKVNMANQRRRAQGQSVANALTPGQIEFERRIGGATYPGQKLHLHHLVPLSKGGGHAWGNIAFIPASLNMSIQDKLPEEVYKQLTLEEGRPSYEWLPREAYRV